MFTMAPLCAAEIASAFSPSRNPCMVKLTPLNGQARYRNDPYNATVLPPIDLSQSPSFVPQISRTVRKVRQAISAVEAAAAQPVEQEAAAVVAVRADAVAPLHVTHYAVVKFKHDFMTYIAPFKLTLGEIVAVEGDRGENIGTVTEITTTPPDYPVTQKVVRHASLRDKEHLANLRRKEAAATKTCQAIAESVGLNIRVVDTEYQFDMNKLTIFFASKVPIDFRKFQRELFREFRCRIWIVNWPRKPHH
jgi:hypothetical protein